MQITNNTTTATLNQDKLLNLIIDQRIVKLEGIFEKKHQQQFLNLPENAFHAHLYMCLVELGLKASEITDVYDVSFSELTRILKACHTKMLVNKMFENYLYQIHLQCKRLKIAA
ncbi:hypothetical protein ACFQ5N_02350 [Lutibacter holmesii]|uniref:DUF2513 domain-containing protein n=1 Tax=Lutibacter holmesii TaxID=1137985 RepID=A0ABW3WLX9_9FLAO